MQTGIEMRRILVHIWKRSRLEHDGRMLIGWIKAVDHTGIFTVYEGETGSVTAGWERDLREPEFQRIASLLRSTSTYSRGNPAHIIMTDRQAHKLPGHVRDIGKKGWKQLLERRLPRVILHRTGLPPLKGEVVVLDGATSGQQIVGVLYFTAHAPKHILMETDWASVEIAALGGDGIGPAAPVERQCTWINKKESGAWGPPGTSPAHLDLASGKYVWRSWGTSIMRQISTRWTMHARTQLPRIEEKPRRNGIISRQLNAASRTRRGDVSPLRAGGVPRGDRAGRESALRTLHPSEQALRSSSPNVFMEIERHKKEAKGSALLRDTEREGLTFLTITEGLGISALSIPYVPRCLPSDKKVTGITTGKGVLLATTSDGTLWSAGLGPTGRQRGGQEPQLRQVQILAEGHEASEYTERRFEPMGKIVDLTVLQGGRQAETVVALIEGREGTQRTQGRHAAPPERVYTWTADETPQWINSVSARRVMGYGDSRGAIAFITAAGKVTGLPQQSEESDLRATLSEQPRSLQEATRFGFERRSVAAGTPWETEIIQESGMEPAINAVTHWDRLTILTITGEIWTLHQSPHSLYPLGDGMEGTWRKVDEADGPGDATRPFHAVLVHAEGGTMIAAKRINGEDRLFSALCLQLPVTEGHDGGTGTNTSMIMMVDNNITLRGRQFNILRGMGEGTCHATFLLTHYRGESPTLYPMEPLRGTGRKPTRLNEPARGNTAGCKLATPIMQEGRTEEEISRPDGERKWEDKKQQPMEVLLEADHMADMLGYLKASDICALVCASARLAL